MALWSALPSGEQVLTRAYYSYVEPIQIAWRKRRRMARFAIASLDGLACGEIDLAPCSRHCIPVRETVMVASPLTNLHGDTSRMLFCRRRKPRGGQFVARPPSSSPCGPMS
jgi:hypothetical protein